MAAGNPDLVSVITADHRVVEGVFLELESGRGSPAQRRDLADYMTAELMRHSVAKEQHIYPATRAALADGDTLADQKLHEHAKAEQVMKDLDGLDATDPRFETLLTKLIGDIRHHIEEEENDLLPKLQETCSETQLRELGEKVLRAKDMAPPRPHPTAPDKPGANKVLGPGA